MADINALINVLQQTTSPDSVTIKLAERGLIEFSRQPGYGTCLLSVITNENVDAGLRLAAAIALKNFVRENWDVEKGVASTSLQLDERRQLRDGVLSAMFALDEPYRRQLSTTICLIGQIDFPANWPELFTILSNQLNGDDLRSVEAALGAIEQLVHRYRNESKSYELFAEIRIVLEPLAQPLTVLYERMMGHVVNANSLNADQQTQLFEILLLGAKCYQSLLSQDFPAYFEDHLEQWMNAFFTLISMSPPSHSTISDLEPTPLDNIKRVICNVFCLFAQRYEEDFEKFMLRAIEGVWQQLAAVDHRPRYDALVNAALGFLSAVCAKLRYAEVFRKPGVLQAVCNDVVIPNLTLRIEDIEQFADEPFDYLKRDVEGNDLETRRRGATEFVRALTKHFEKEVFEILGNSIRGFMGEYASDVQKWTRKDVVYFLVSALASKSTTARLGAITTSELINVTDFYAQYVRADLFGIDFNAHPPILVADALNFLVLFRNHFDSAVLLEVFGGNDPIVLRILQSQTRVLHHYVGYAFDKLFSTQKQSPFLTAQTLPVTAYIDRFCETLRAPDAEKTHYLIKAILRSFSIMDAKSVERADNYVAFLVRLVEGLVREMTNAQFTHIVFECLCVVIKKTFPYIQNTINNQLVPIIEQIIEKEATDFIPYALQIVAVLLYQMYEEQRLGRTVAGREKYESFLPHLLAGKLWQTHANAPALMSILEAFIRSNPELVFRPANSSAIMGLYTTLIKSRQYEEQGFRLAVVLMPHYNIDANVTARNILLQMLQRLSDTNAGKMIRFKREFVMFLCRFAYTKGGMQLAEAANAIQANLYCMLIEAFVIPELSAPIARNYEEKTLIVFGLSRMCADTVALVGKDFAKLVEAAIGVLEATAVTNDANVDLPNDAEYADRFCKLSNVTTAETIGADINVKHYLANAITSEAASVDAACLNCLNDRQKQQLTLYATAQN